MANHQAMIGTHFIVMRTERIANVLIHADVLTVLKDEVLVRIGFVHHFVSYAPLLQRVNGQRVCLIGFQFHQFPPT